MGSRWASPAVLSICCCSADQETIAETATMKIAPVTLPIERVTTCSFFLAVLRVPSSLLSAVNRSDMTLDVPCPGLLRLLLAVHSQRGENPTFATLELSVSAVSKRIHVESPRFLR